jgi:hypothetical protein
MNAPPPGAVEDRDTLFGSVVRLLLARLEPAPVADQESLTHRKSAPFLE